jgi:oligopeptide transport system permease protein
MMLYVILLMVVLGKSLLNVFITLGIIYWVGMARIVRGQVLALKEQEFVLAAKAAGASKSRIILRHLIPNSMGAIIVTLTLSIPQAIFTEAFLSFIGLGVAAPMSSWGTLCNDALATYKSFPYQLFIPALAISITMVAFNLFGDGLRDALDPKMRK